MKLEGLTDCQTDRYLEYESLSTEHNYNGPCLEAVGSQTERHWTWHSFMTTDSGVKHLHCYIVTFLMFPAQLSLTTRTLTNHCIQLYSFFFVFLGFVLHSVQLRLNLLQFLFVLRQCLHLLLQSVSTLSQPLVQPASSLLQKLINLKTP